MWSLQSCFDFENDFQGDQQKAKSKNRFESFLIRHLGNHC